VGGGAPGRDAVRQFLAKVDADEDWYPGKTAQTTFGRKPALSGQNRASIARSMMALKEHGAEPTYALACGSCPQAVINPSTGKPVDKKRIYDVMRESCYDEVPEEPWAHRPRLSKTSLSADVIENRHTWAEWVKSLNHRPSWYYDHLVWTDLCNSILPRSISKAKEQAQARKGSKGWMSEGTQMYSQNLRAAKTALKQNSWDTIRVWWAPVLLRGKVHVELLGVDFPGETPAGAALLVAKVRSAINVRCQTADKPDTLFVDRGRGFYNTGNGKITADFAAALRTHSLQVFMGSDAARQPGNLQDLMLHETVVAWVRRLMAASTPAAPWNESVEQYGQRLRAAFAKCNSDYDVESLSREFPERVQSVLDAGGDRLCK